jgi:hypothetical protein
MEYIRLHNIEWTIKANKLVITMDISEATLSAAPASSTGKTKLAATTAGALSLPPQHGKALSIAVNLMTKG